MDRETVLTIAGSDPCGGAGIQADLKTLVACGVHGVSAITAITAQNTCGVQQVFPLPADQVAAQIDALAEDLKIGAAKTGILCQASIVRVVCQKASQYRWEKLVVDPVLAAGSGHAFLQGEDLRVFREELLPLAYLLTPNLAEAEALTGMKEIQDSRGMKEAAVKLHALGARNVLLKGGHLPGEPLDLLYDGIAFTEYREERRPGLAHGTGCTLAAAIAAGLAQGLALQEAVGKAKAYLVSLLDHPLKLGQGQLLLDPLFPLRREAERYALLQETNRALERLKQERIGRLIPEVQSNFGVALTGAEGAEDVLAVPGRIIGLGEEIHWIRPPAFGVSRHVAKIVLTVLRHDPARRAAMNIRYSPEILEACHRLQLKIGSFRRSDEPAEVMSREGASLEWGTEEAIRHFGGVPDIIHDEGGIGKEAMIRVLGADAEDLANRVIAIQREVTS